MKRNNKRKNQSRALCEMRYKFNKARRMKALETIQENMKLMPQILQNAETSGQNIDLSGFLTKNINLD